MVSTVHITYNIWRRGCITNLLAVKLMLLFGLTNLFHPYVPSFWLGLKDVYSVTSPGSPLCNCRVIFLSVNISFGSGSLPLLLLAYVSHITLIIFSPLFASWSHHLLFPSYSHSFIYLTYVNLLY